MSRLNYFVNIGRPVAGDYVTTVRAASRGESASQSFRVAVTTSTMWGIVGIALIGGALLALIRSSRPQRARRCTPGTWIWCVESVSLGKVALSTSKTFWPARANSIANGEPPQRAPTTIASYMAPILRPERDRTVIDSVTNAGQIAVVVAS